MDIRLPAIFESGILRPLEPLNLTDGDLVVLTITTDEEQLYLASPVEWAEAARERVTRQQAMQTLAGIKGSLSDSIIRERQER